MTMIITRSANDNNDVADSFDTVDEFQGEFARAFNTPECVPNEAELRAQARREAREERLSEPLRSKEKFPQQYRAMFDGRRVGCTGPLRRWKCVAQLDLVRMLLRCKWGSYSLKSYDAAYCARTRLSGEEGTLMWEYE